MNRRLLLPVVSLVFASAQLSAADAPGGDDAYAHYVKTSKDFKPVKQDKDWALAAFPSWTNMPWTYQWTIGYTPASGRWSLEHGYNGAFLDHGDPSDGKTKTGKLDWIDQFKLRFYVDHTAGKGDLHLWDGDAMKPHINQIHGAGVRVKPLNAAMLKRLKDTIRHNIETVKASPNRGAYALDDEVSWGHFVHPTMWQVTDDSSAYQTWLKEIYGAAEYSKVAPSRQKWITYEDIRSKLPDWDVAHFDASQLMDQWSFNDSYWNNFVGDLVEYANSVDPHTPCGYVGGQAPNAFGGFDYAKLMRKIQYLEAYNIGGSQSIARSFNPGNALPMVTSQFHRSADDDIWQTWYYLAHGNRGFIGWVDGWFSGDKPKPWHDQVAPTYLEATSKIGPLLSGATWQHDGVAIYYSHASIQLGWIMDAAAHGKTWINRNGDDRLGASHHVRHAWENMLRDSGLQYSYVSYADVIQHGVPKEYKVLILPACLCLSDAEAREIEAFCKRGGTVIADYLPGLWDQHGKGRSSGGALDQLFGVKHDGALKSSDLWSGNQLWCEVNQDANFGWKTYKEFLTNDNKCLRDESGYNKVVRKAPVAHVAKAGQGTAVLMNLSPQWYNAYRQAGAKDAEKRDTFIRHVTAGGVAPRVRIKNAGDAELGYEITYWRKAGREIAILCFNPEVIGSETGGGNAAGLKTKKLPVTLQFAHELQGARDERTGKSLGAGKEFSFDWPMNEAVVVSYAVEN